MHSRIHAFACFHTVISGLTGRPISIVQVDIPLADGADGLQRRTASPLETATDCGIFDDQSYGEAVLGNRQGVGESARNALYPATALAAATLPVAHRRLSQGRQRAGVRSAGAQCSGQKP